MDNNIPQLLAILREGEIAEELLAIILPIAQGKEGHEKGQGINNSEEAEATAVDFILYLKDNLGVGDLRKKSDLNREFNRWLTKSQAGEDHELWSILSEALLALEKDGKCQRGKDFEKFHNNNNTIWFLPGQAKGIPDCSECNPAIAGIPTYRPVKRSIDAKNQAKIIPPSSARELVMKILTAVCGPIKMSQILDIAKEKVVLTKVVYFDPVDGDQDGDGKDIAPNIPDKTSAFAIFIQEEVQDRVMLVWDDVAGIERGKGEKIPGHKILCLYIIPSEILQRSVNMEEFGPTSTVDNVKTDVYKVLQKYLSFEEMLNGFDEVMLPTQVIKIKIIQEINKKCSENGYKTGLDDIEDEENN